MAPEANVHFIAAASCYDPDLLGADALIVNTAPGEHRLELVRRAVRDATNQTWDQLFEYGAVEGIGFMFSSGDSGYEDPAVEDPDGGPASFRSTTRPRAHG